MPARAQNSFLSENDTSVALVREKGHSFLDQLARWQQRLNQRMSALTREARDSGSLRPLLSLVAIAFIYGVLHAAGPGHGKAVTTAYLFSSEKKMMRGILLGNMVAVFHGLSGMVFVLLIYYIFKHAVMDSLQHVTRVTQIVSYGAIAGIGFILFIKNIFFYAKKDVPEQSTAVSTPPLSMAAAIGIIPCPGVALVMLFCISLNELGLGMLLSFFLVLGMATTISAIGVAGLAGKHFVLKILQQRPGLFFIAEQGIAMISSFLIFLLGLLFLAGIFLN